VKQWEAAKASDLSTLNAMLASHQMESIPSPAPLLAEQACGAK
jgi:hypothetical protein